MKKVIIIVLQLAITAILTFIVGYWSMKPETNQNISSSCLDCSLESDLAFHTAFTTVIIGLFLVVSNRFQALKTHQLKVQIILIIIFWLLMNKFIFDDRISSWSTFTLTSEWLSVFIISFFPILVCGTLYFGVLYFIKNKL